MSNTLKYENIVKEFKTKTGTVRALKSVSTEVEEGELFCLLGPSGCGKTTLLRCTAGLEQINEGKIYYGGTDFATVPPYKRNLGMVFQNYALYPHLSIFENVAYALRIRKTPESEIKQKVQDILTLVGMLEQMHRNPSELSGGQQQRVALARALVYNPKLLLLDEPLANLDAKLKVQMRGEIRRIQKASKVTAIYVTHDQQEAMAISDRLAIMKDGYIQQVGSPDEIYSNPINQFVAGFIGTMNFFTASLGSVEGNKAMITVGNQSMEVLMNEQFPEKAENVVVAIRPANLKLAPETAEASSALSGKVSIIQFLGEYIRYQITTQYEGENILVQIDSARRVEGVAEGTRVIIDFQPEDILVFCNGERVY